MGGWGRRRIGGWGPSRLGLAGQVPRHDAHAQDHQAGKEKAGRFAGDRGPATGNTYQCRRQEDQGQLDADQDQLGPPDRRAEERQYSGAVQFRNEPDIKATKVAAIIAKISRAVVMSLTKYSRRYAASG
jgi:hypothetical protein